jgi:LysR family hydrogen peroxide-inducible transcriptional activator
MIDRHHLRYFLAVVDAGNFSKAARQVNVTQPTLSVGIAKLEGDLGARVFLRNNQRVQLTPAGVALLAHARTIEGEFNALETRLTDARPSRPLRIGVLSTLPTRLTCQLVSSVRASAAPEPVELVEGAERDLVARLQRDRIDVALTLVRDGDRRFGAEILFEEGYGVVLPDWHDLAGLAEIRGDLLANETMIVRRQCEVLAETSRYFTERGVRPRFSFRSTNDDRVMSLVKAGLGITVAAESYAGDGLRVVRLAGFNPRRRIGLAFASQEVAARPSTALAALRSLAS